MSERWPWLLAGAVLLMCLIAGVRSCAERGDTPSDVRADMAAPNASPAATGVADAEAEAAARMRDVRRDQAIRDAVATLHRYLAALGDEDRSAADAFWSGGKPPARSGEADLRTLTRLRALRIENGNPTALDAEAVPNALEIPVELRASVQDAPQRRYRGWYRLRRAVSGDRWEITSAAIDAVPAQR